MKKIYFFSLAALICLGLVFSCQAQTATSTTDTDTESQTDAVTVATVNIFQPNLISQKDNEFNISFEIFNRTGVQPGIKYAVNLYQQQDEELVLVDQKVYDEVLTLGAEKTIPLKVSYTAPAHLVGNYELWVVSQSEKGFPFGQVKVGDITLAGTNEFIDIDSNSCYLTVDEEKNKYSLNEGVDISAQEKLLAHCSVYNHFQSDVSAAASWEIYYRNSFGKKVSSLKQDPMEFIPQTSKVLTWEIPVAASPQAYDAVLTLVDEKNQPVSNKIFFHYVLQGQSATIQNLTLDKKNYLKNDTAKISFLWSAAANLFPGARGKASSEECKLEIMVRDAKGNACIDPINQVLETKAGDDWLELEAKVINNCEHPKAIVAIKDKENNILDKAELDLQPSEDSAEALPLTKAIKDKNCLEVAVIMILLILVLFVSIIYLLKKFSIKGKRAVFILLGLGLGWLGVGLASPALADTIYLRDGTVTYYFTIGLNKSKYLPNENIIASGNARFSACINDVFYPSLEATVNGVTKGVLYRSTAFKAESTPGEYQARFHAAVSGSRIGKPFISGDGYIPYTVVSPALNGTCGSANGSTQCSQPSANLCSSGTPGAVSSKLVSGKWVWSWECQGSGGGSSQNCQANMCAGQCGSPTRPAPDTIGACNAPTSGLCTSGSPSSVTRVGNQYTWTCSGTPASNPCTYDIQCNGVCDDPGDSCNAPNTNLCQQKDPLQTISPTLSGSTWNWTCNGINGTNRSCSSSKVCPPPPPEPGVCGSDNNARLCNTPTSLCTVGSPNPSTPNFDSSTNTWTWRCKGLNGGPQSGQCRATKANCDNRMIEIIP